MRLGRKRECEGKRNSDLQFFESGSVEGLAPTLCSKGHLFPFDMCPLANFSVHSLQSLASISVVWHPIERLWNPNRSVPLLVVVLFVSWHSLFADVPALSNIQDLRNMFLRQTVRPLFPLTIFPTFLWKLILFL